MLSIIIAILMSLGIISTPQDYHDLSSTEQTTLNDWVIEEDVIGN